MIFKIVKLLSGFLAFLLLISLAVAQANENVTNVTKKKPRPFKTLKKILQFAKALLDKIFSILLRILGLIS